jgi:hypothetical protein
VHIVQFTHSIHSFFATMASGMPLPVPPRTPTPPPEDLQKPMGLGIDQFSPTKLGYNPDALSPLSATFPPERFGTLGGPNTSISQRPTPSTVYSPANSTFPYSPMSAQSGTSENNTPSMSGSENNVRNPFNFQPMAYVPGKSAASKQVVWESFQENL